MDALIELGASIYLIWNEASRTSTKPLIEGDILGRHYKCGGKIEVAACDSSHIVKFRCNKCGAKATLTPAPYPHVSRCSLVGLRPERSLLD